MGTRFLLGAGLTATIAIVAAVAASTAMSRTAANVSFTVHYSGTLSEHSTESDTASTLTHCDAAVESGALTSKVGPGKTKLTFFHEPGSRSIEILWGGNFSGNPVGITSYTEQAQGTIDERPCGGTLEPIYDTSHCGSATRKGSVSFTPTDKAGVELSQNTVGPYNEHNVELKFGWDPTPGLLNGCNAGPATFSTSAGLDIYGLAAQPVDYLKLFRCRVNRHTGCNLTLHGSNTFPVHDVEPGDEGRVTTTDGTATLKWTVAITSGS